MRRVDPACSRIVLVGVAAYADPEIPDEPTITNNLTDLVSVLTDPTLGGFASDHLMVAPAQAGVGQVGDLLLRAADEAEDLLLFYYVGHGFPTRTRADLYLSLAGTRIDALAYTALPYDAVRDTFLNSRARSRVVILDSCYSGKAIGPTLGDVNLLEHLAIGGTYTLTASPATRPATAALPGERHTAFTGRLLALLRAGTPQAGPDLSLGDIYRHLRSRLHADGLPEPQQRGTETGDLLALTPNPGYVPPPTIQPAALPDDLRAGLESRYPGIRAAAVSELAALLEDADPGRVLAARTALHEVADTDRPEVADLARSALNRLSSPEATSSPASATVKKPVRATTCRVWAASVLRAAEIRARTGTEDPEKAEALAMVGVARATTPIRGSSLVDEAEQIAHNATSPSTKADALLRVAQVVAASDPDRAVRIVNSVNWSHAGSEGAAKTVRLVAAIDPGRAEAIANAIGSDWPRTEALAEIVKVLAATDPDRAEAMGLALPDNHSAKPAALADVARAVAASEPGRAARLIAEAERITRDLDWPAAPQNQLYAQAAALAVIAKVVAADDPDRALRLTHEAERIADGITDEWQKGFALVPVVAAAAMTDLDQAEAWANAVTDLMAHGAALAAVVRQTASREPDRAERIANSIAQSWHKGQALRSVAEAVLADDPDRAEAIAHEITDPHWKPRLLIDVAMAVAARDLDRAAMLVQEAESTAREPSLLVDVANAWLRLAELASA